MEATGTSDLHFAELAEQPTDPIVAEGTTSTGAGVVLGTLLVFVALILGSAMLARERRWGPRPRRR